MKLSWNVFAALAGIFVAGAVTGTFVGPDVVRAFAPKPTVGDQLTRLTEQLDLTAAQRDKIRPIQKQATEDLRKTRRDAFKATTAIFERMEADIAKELTDAQRAKFTEMQAKERERRKQWLQDKPKPRGDNRQPPGGSEGPGPHHEGPPSAVPTAPADVPVPVSAPATPAPAVSSATTGM